MKHRVGNIADFPLETINVVTVGARSIGIINTKDALYAVLNICPHELAPICSGAIVSGTLLPCRPGELEYGLEDRILRCPWHRYEFDLGDDGRAVFTNFRGKVRMFAVSVEDGQVMVEMSDRGSTPAKK